MNVIRMTGGLGNQMFEYALFLKYKSMGIESSFEDFSEYEGHDNRRPILLKEAFNIDYPRVDLKKYYSLTDSNPSVFSKIRRKVWGAKTSVYEEATADFDSEVLSVRDSYICGYFQSDKYFEDIKEEVLSAYSFREEVRDLSMRILRDSLEKAQETIGDSEEAIEQILKKAVSIHIRRGDYLDNAGNYGNICTDEYYDNAIRYFTDYDSEALFLVFSNDVRWTDEWILEYRNKGIRMVNVVGTTEDTGYCDMYLMSRCTNNIVANSSFSWWGAYLNNSKNKKVIAPSKWTNHLNQRDIYTKDMIII